VIPPSQIPTVVAFGTDVFDRMVEAVRRVRERIQRSTMALEIAGVPYVVIGEVAVAAWISKIDPSAARNTVAVDLLVHRRDFSKAKVALESVGFVHDDETGVELFLDGLSGKRREAVRLTFVADDEGSNESSILRNAVQHETFWIAPLETLVIAGLTAFRVLDRVLLRDLIDVGLVDESWIRRLGTEYGERLQSLLDNPE
jgi:hypothetical protein